MDALQTPGEREGKYELDNLYCERVGMSGDRRRVPANRQALTSVARKEAGVTRALGRDSDKSTRSLLRRSANRRFDFSHNYWREYAKPLRDRAARGWRSPFVRLQQARASHR